MDFDDFCGLFDVLWQIKGFRVVAKCVLAIIFGLLFYGALMETGLFK